ncbi:MAG TPA: hypothetical protein VFE46_00425 [Pirellulales bacterium]|jgi:hypothetical protein|nr:hypothetical protein [Pirellulales bacterium]
MKLHAFTLQTDQTEITVPPCRYLQIQSYFGDNSLEINGDAVSLPQNTSIVVNTSEGNTLEATSLLWINEGEGASVNVIWGV